MNDMLVGILGLAAIAATVIVISLTRGKMLPAMAFILLKASALYVWSFSFLCLVFAIFIELVPF